MSIAFMPSFAASAYEISVMDEFTDASIWAGTNSAYISTCTNVSYVKSGNTSARLLLAKEKKGDYEFLYKNGSLSLVKSKKRVEAISLWVYGCNNQSADLRIKYGISSGKTEYTRRMGLGFSGWKKFTLSIPDAVCLYGFSLRNNAGINAEIYIDKLETEYNDQLDVSPNTIANPQVLQLNNTNELKPVNYIGGGDSTAGATIFSGSFFRRATPDVKWINNGPHMLIDGDYSTNFTSALYNYQPYPEDEWVQVELSSVKNIYKVVLVPSAGGYCFPIDYQILLSEDGESWIEGKVSKDNNVSSAAPLSYKIVPAKRAKYVRIKVDKLKSQGSGSNAYYNNISELEVYASDSSSKNIASAENGGKATASNMLYGDEFDYDKFYDDIFDSGVSTVVIGNENVYKNWKSQDEWKPTHTESENIKKLKEHGLTVLYRVMNAPTYYEIQADREAMCNFMVNVFEAYVPALKDYVDIWGVFNEINFYGGNAKAPEDYAYIIKKCAEVIKKYDPTAKVDIESALADTGWIDALMKHGLDSVIDSIGMHIYKEQPKEVSYPEISGNYVHSGKDNDADGQVNLDFKEEINAYRSVVDKYNHNILLYMTEVSEPFKSMDNDNERVAKWLTRQYCINKSLGFAATCWFTIDAVNAPDIVSTLVDVHGVRQPAWYALRNFNYAFCDSPHKTDKKINVSGNVGNLMYDVYESETEYVIPYWYATSFSGDFSGSLINIDLSGLGYVKDVTAVDLLTGREQKINLECKIARNLISRDYVTVLKVNKNINESEDDSEYDMLWAGFENGNENFSSWNEKVLTLNQAEDGLCTEGSSSLKATVNIASAKENGSNRVAIKVNRLFPKPPEVKVLRKILMDVYVNDSIAANYMSADYRADVNGEEIIPQGSCFFGQETERSFVKGINIKLNNGWNTVSFDVTNGSALDYLYWRADFNSDKKNNIETNSIYIDNVRLVYSDIRKPVESFDDYAGKWYGPNDVTDGADYYNLSQNYDSRYISEGSGSLCINVTDTGKTKNTNAFRYGYWFNGQSLVGKVIPSIDGVTANSLWMDVYNDTGGEAVIIWEGEQATLKNKSGWNKISFPVKDRKTITQFAVYAPNGGNLYFDNMKIEYGVPISEITSLVNNGEEFDTIKSGDEIYFVLSVDKYEMAGKKYTIILGLYDKNGSLISVNTALADIDFGTTGKIKKAVSQKIENADKIGQIKGLVWDGILGMSPIDGLNKLKVINVIKE